MYYDGNTVKLFTIFTYTIFKCSFLFILSI